MRKILVTGLIILPSIFAQAQKSVNLDGELKNIAEPIEKVFINYSANGERITDSATVTGSKYHFTLKLDEPTMAALSPKYTNGLRLSQGKMRTIVFLDVTNMKMIQADSFSNTKLIGSKANDEYVKITESNKAVAEKRTALIQEYIRFDKEKNVDARNNVAKQIDSIDEGVRKTYGAYVEGNPSSPIAIFALSQFAGHNIVASEVEPLFNKIPKATQATPSGKHLGEAIAIAKKTGIGQTAMDFTQNDTLGNPVKLSSFKGKYVLLDFWASWCGPCRAENPNVVKVYNTYKAKGFEVLGVSLDRNNAKEKWLKAIHDDRLAWTQVSDLQFWNNAVAKMYGVQSIPQNFLIDPNGKIIGKNLRGEELEKKLTEIFN